MALAISNTNTPPNKILILSTKPIPQDILCLVTELFIDLLPLNQYVCKNLTTTDGYILAIPRAALKNLLRDPVYRFPQVKLVYVYDENNESFESDQKLQNLYPKLCFCLERDLPKKLATPIIDNAVDPSRPIDRVAINNFASSVTQRLSTKRPASTNRYSSAAPKHLTSTSSQGFLVRNINLIDLKFICPKCNLILREPYQLNCGHRICHSCITIENNEMGCLVCPEVSSIQIIWRDKGFQIELDQLLISCGVCDWTETLKYYQEHIDHTHQEHADTTEIHQTDLMRVLRNNDQRQNSFSQIQNRVTNLSNSLTMLNNEQQRIHDSLCSSQNSLQAISQQMITLRSSSLHNDSIANGIAFTNHLIGHEISSFKQMMEDGRTASYDGTFIWKITSVKEKFADAISERQKSIYSPVFYSSPCGYKMCLRLYLNGDGDVRGEYVSVFLVIMRSDNDRILHWPFLYKIKCQLMDQSTLDHNQRNISDEFWPDPTSPCFQRPCSLMNEAYGIKKFVSLELLRKHCNLYIEDDTLFIKIEGNYTEQRPESLANTGTGATPNDEGHVDTINENIMYIS